ncbi:MAG: Hpt domain-containing protein [Treponema sp.]|nr:Hpt domain-containing protein [Treponema sp.]
MKQLLNTASALDMLSGDTSLYKLLADSFLYENHFERHTFNALITARKLTEAASYVHRTKGAAGQIGAELLHEAGQQLEDALRGRSDGDIAELAAHFANIYDKTISALTEQHTRI